jgi:tRNA pseudouridine38-40 synthase
MYYYKVKISYKGTHYFGWQAQAVAGGNEEKPTVQGTLHHALKRIAKYKECTIAGASRTDAGVHAQGQLAKFSIPVDLAADKLLLGMNSLLPDDIRIVACEVCARDFNPNTSSASKEYHYYFSTAHVENPALSDCVASVPGHIDLQEMQRACKLFIGEHDFYNFCSRDANLATTIRSISCCEIHKADFSPFGEDIFYLKISGNGFLRYMIRYIVGALFKVLQGKISRDDLNNSLLYHQEDKLSAKAKSKGLHLIRIQEQTRTQE